MLTIRNVTLLTLPIRPLTPRLTLPVSGEHSVLSPTEGCDIYIVTIDNIYQSHQ